MLTLKVKSFLIKFLSNKIFNIQIFSPQKIDLKQEPLCQKSCKRDCHQVRYNIANSNAKKTLALTNKHKSIISRDLITVSFMWGSFEYVGLEQSWKYSAVDFIGALGGAIGIYLGLSVLTLVVGLVYGCDLSYNYMRDYWADKNQSYDINAKNNANGGNQDLKTQPSEDKTEDETPNEDSKAEEKP